MALFLLAGSSPRLVGDGREYVAQAINFASFHGPAIRTRDIDRIQSEMARLDPSLAAWDIRGATVSDSHRDRDFQHFWFYALLAAPGLWVAELLHVSPLWSFVGVNLVLLGIALWVVLPRISTAGAVLLFMSPVIWWIDKAHTETLTFSLLMVVFAACEDRPWWAMIAAAAAALQNPPIAAVIVFVWLGAVLNNRAALTDRRVVAAALAALALASMHPLYTFAHHHTASLLLSATRAGAPSFAALSAVVLDPTVGLIGNFPALLVVTIVAAFVLATSGRHLFFTRGMGVAAAAAAVFLFSFSRTTNVHHGGTPSLSRYAIWLIPLAVPVLAVMHQSGGERWRRFLWAAAVTSAVGSILAFRPSLPQNSREPTALASFLWTRLPTWNNPLPEVFSETQLHLDDLWVPVATSGCEKVLLGGAVTDAVWPIPCYPAPLPPSCQRPGGLCYANRTKAGYQFAVAPGGAVAKLRSDDVWPERAAPHVRRIYDAWDWRTLDPGATDVEVVQGTEGVSVVPIGSKDRFILILRRIRPAAVVQLRPEQQLRGVLSDALSGRTLSSESCAGGEVCRIEVPSGFDIVLLAMRR
jgi:hypothetical protein